MFKSVGFLLLGFVLCAAGSAGEPAFTSKPAVTRDGEVVKIGFAISAPADAAVYIEDANGKVIRHLAAGVLGTNPPPPFKAGLVQEIAWDGKADYGKPAVGGPFKVRVALGLGAKCDRIFSRPEKFSGGLTLGIGPDGSVYIREIATQVTQFPKRRLVVLNRDGSYLRTLLPFPATPGGEAGKGVPGSIVLAGRAVPGREVENDLMPWLGNSATATMAVSADGKTLYFPLCGGNPFRPAEILRISTEGGGVVGRHPLDKAKIGELPEFGDRSHMAVSADGRSLFMFGLQDRRGKGGPAVIYRLRLPECTDLEVFFGERGVPGKDAGHLGTTAGGLASDGKGHLFVCDSANNRILVIGEDDAKMKGEIPCKSPSNVGIHRATGAVYVAIQDGAKLTKLGSWQNPNVVSEAPLPRKGAGADTVSMVVDGTAERAVIWLATSRCGYLARAEDTGNRFEVTEVGGKFESMHGPRHEFGYYGLAVDRAAAEVYVMNSGTGHCWERFDESGKSEFVLPQGISNGSASGSGPQLVPGPDQVLYGIWWRHAFVKWDRNGKSLVWDEPRLPTEEELKVYPEKPPAPGPSVMNYARVGMVGLPHTLGVRWSDGRIFVFEPYMITQGDGGRIPKALHEYLPSGKRVTTPDNPIIWKVSDPALGPKFDAAGNIYIAEVVRPKGWKQPPELKGEGLANHYGSIVKFSPKGGMIHFDGADPFIGKPKLDPALKTIEVDFATGAGNLKPVKVTGAEWIHPGIGHIGYYGCNCENVTFDVDEFGRVFFPDPLMYQIRVIDTSGNAITTIGGYGNADNCGPMSAVIDPKTNQPRPRRADDLKDLKSPFAEPDIAMSWPTGVGVTDKHLYVADSINRRMVRGRILYAAEEVCSIP